MFALVIATSAFAAPVLPGEDSWCISLSRYSGAALQLQQVAILTNGTTISALYYQPRGIDSCGQKTIRHRKTRGMIAGDLRPGGRSGRNMRVAPVAKRAS